MKRTTLDLLACPSCCGPLDYAGTTGNILRLGTLVCSQCQKKYPFVDGIPHFIQPAALTGFNRRFARLYNWFSWGYR